MIQMQQVQVLKPDPRAYNTDTGTHVLWWTEHVELVQALE